MNDEAMTEEAGSTRFQWLGAFTFRAFDGFAWGLLAGTGAVTIWETPVVGTLGIFLVAGVALSFIQRRDRRRGRSVGAPRSLGAWADLLKRSGRLDSLVIGVSVAVAGVLGGHSAAVVVLVVMFLAVVGFEFDRRRRARRAP